MVRVVAIARLSRTSNITQFLTETWNLPSLAMRRRLDQVEFVLLQYLEIDYLLLDVLISILQSPNSSTFKLRTTTQL